MSVCHGAGPALVDKRAADSRKATALSDVGRELTRRGFRDVG